jgi:heterokaryon incompatibility protein (HET)
LFNSIIPSQSLIRCIGFGVLSTSKKSQFSVSVTYEVNMRLLHTTKFHLEEFYRDDIPQYAILSHTWGKEEVLFQDIQNGTASRKAGWAKVEGCCSQARADNFEWIWIDTLCIDKSSSAELSEAINSMFAWYSYSVICYAYLVDVDADMWDLELDKKIENSRWFTRGWTLQELIAPKVVEFYSTNWIQIGTKRSLRDVISRISGIPTEVLRGAKSYLNCNVGERMSWASLRQTTRVEDIAYCLIGLFNIHMPLLYGEGRRAFQRLQEEILKISFDKTLFIWSNHSEFPDTGGTILADSPRDFCIEQPCGRCANYGRISNYSDIFPSSIVETTFVDPPLVTPFGLRMTMLVSARDHIDSNYNVFLDCAIRTHTDEYLQPLLMKFRDQGIPGKWSKLSRTSHRPFFPSTHPDHLANELSLQTFYYNIDFRSRTPLASNIPAVINIVPATRCIRLFQQNGDLQAEGIVYYLFPGMETSFAFTHANATTPDSIFKILLLPVQDYIECLLEGWDRRDILRLRPRREVEQTRGMSKDCLILNTLRGTRVLVKIKKKCPRSAAHTHLPFDIELDCEKDCENRQVMNSR